MFQRNCLFQPLKNVIVGHSYLPEFYSFIKDDSTKSKWQKIAAETEEDYQTLIGMLNDFGVEVIRARCDGHAEFKRRQTTNAWFKQFGFVNGLIDYPVYDSVLPPPMEPRDWFMMLGDKFIHWLDPQQLVQYQHILNFVKAQGNKVYHTDTHINAEGWITQIGKRITYSLGGANWFPRPRDDFQRFADTYAPEYDNRFYDVQGFADGVYRPIKEGLIVSLYEKPRYERDFPNWDVIPVTHDSWGKMDKWLKFKRDYSYLQWNWGEEADAARKKLVDEWIDAGWQQYCSENVFDVNLLSVDESNVIVFNYNKDVFDGLKRHGVNAHVCHFRHRYFWGGGIHCITSDINRSGDLIDYFSERK